VIISHRKKFAFFANQKTGSKAAGIALRMAGVFDDKDIMSMQPFLGTRTARFEMPHRNLNGRNTWKVDHMTPQEAIDEGYITLDQLREYDCYAFLRNPEDRYLAARVAMQINRYGAISKGDNPKPMSGTCPPQHVFFYVGDEQVVTPLDFDNYEQGLRTMIDKLGGINHLDLPEVVQQAPAKFIKGREVKYDPQLHREDEKLYRIMKHASNNQQTS